MDRFRVISDLHLDINRNYPLKAKKDDIFTVIAGDTCGSPVMVDYKSENGIRLKIKDEAKLLDFLGKNSGTAVISYSKETRKWIYNGKSFNMEEAGLSVELSMCIGITDGEKVTFSMKNIAKWIKSHISKGILIAGNHIVYNSFNRTIEELKEMAHKDFPENGDIVFMDESVGVMSKEVDGILFIASTLYTDYRYLSGDNWRYGDISDNEHAVEINMREASPKFSGGYMNDFRWGRTYEATYERNPWDEADEKYWLTPRNYLNWFNRTFQKIQKLVEDNKDKEIVIVTHHCPSPRCISKEYVSDSMNASYVSDLEDFIIKHPNIKCWCCGHVHHFDSFKIGEHCLLVMNPLGYCKDGQFKGDDMDWSFDTFVNTKTWTLEVKPFDTTSWNKKYEADRKKDLALLKKYGSAFFF